MIMCPVSLQLLKTSVRNVAPELDFVNIDLEAFVAAAPHLEAISLEERTTQKPLVQLPNSAEPACAIAI
jgi:hypothetical protein